MASSSRPTTYFWSVAIITTSIVAGFLVFSLLSIFTPVGNKPSGVVRESSVKFLLGCMRLKHLFPFPTGPFESQEEEWVAILCKDSLRAIQHSYQSNGRLGSEYVEALKILYRNNQTDVDIHICGLDFRRCPNHTLALKSFHTSLDILHC